VLKFGGAKALTKHLHDEALKSTLTLEDIKVAVIPKMIDNSLVIGDSNIADKPKAKIRMAKQQKAAMKRTSRLEKATTYLYDLEECHATEKPLNIDLGLYQMEDY
jgi:hypothetical protein